MSSLRACAGHGPKVLPRLLEALTSLKLAISCLALLMVLVVLCTLAQVKLGTIGAVQATIRSLFVYWTPSGTSWKIPVFPGGGLVGAVLLANLVCAQFMRLELSWRKAGLWLTHVGLVVFFLGEFATGFLQVEAQMPIEVGETMGHAESPRELELVLVDTTDPGSDQVYSVSQAALAREARIVEARLPFTLLVKRYYANSNLGMGGGSEGTASLATMGIGPQLRVTEEPPVTADDRVNQAAAFVEILAGDASLGTWLVSNGLGSPQGFSHKGRTYRLALRPRRYYLPFSLTLKEFRHEVYPGTDIPRHFSSLVRLEDPPRGESRDVLISMNQPLRHRGKAFYQASFGKDDRLSILQVVENPGWLMPYAAFFLLGAGLLVHFAAHLKRAFWEGGA